MGIIRDLKNIFFGASAVTKSAAEKVGEVIKEEGGELLGKTKEMATDSVDALGKKSSGLKDAILDETGDLMAKTKEKLIDIGDDINENPLTEKIKDKSEDILTKAGEVSTVVGGVVMEKGGELLEKTKDLSENVGEKVLKVTDKLADKASDVKDQLSEKLDETMNKADAWAADQKANPKPDFAEDTLDASGSLLEGKDDFFSKADKFATGDYGAFSEGKVTIDENSKTIKEKVDFDKLPPATGFEDLDGDGNEIIDLSLIHI